MTMAIRLGGLAAALVLTAPGAAAFADPASSLSVLLRPGPMDEAKGTGSVEIELRFSDLPVAAGAPLVSLPRVIANTASVTDSLTRLQASDADGEIPLTVRD